MEFSYSDNEAAIFAIVSGERPLFKKLQGFLKSPGSSRSVAARNLGTGELGKDKKRTGNTRYWQRSGQR